MDPIRELAEAADPSAAEAIAALDRLAVLGRRPPPDPTHIDHVLQKTKPSAAVLVPLFIGRSNTLYVLLSRSVLIALLFGRLGRVTPPKPASARPAPFSRQAQHVPSTPADLCSVGFTPLAGGAIIFAATRVTRPFQEARSKPAMSPSRTPRCVSGLQPRPTRQRLLAWRRPLSLGHAVMLTSTGSRPVCFEQRREAHEEIGLVRDPSKVVFLAQGPNELSREGMVVTP
jgi:hypothetical protein